MHVAPLGSILQDYRLSAPPGTVEPIKQMALLAGAVCTVIHCFFVGMCVLHGLSVIFVEVGLANMQVHDPADTPVCLCESECVH